MSIHGDDGRDERFYDDDGTVRRCNRCNQAILDHAVMIVGRTDTHWICPIASGSPVDEVVDLTGGEL